MPLISVVVPVYNAGPYLRPCLESIAAQTHKNIQVLLVENASSDQSEQVCRDFCARDSRFHLYAQTDNLGAAGARAQGAALAEGEYLAFVDGDDLIHPQMLEAMLHAMEESGLPVSCCRYAPFFSDELLQEDPVPNSWTALHSPAHLQALLRDQRVDYSLCNKLYRRSVMLPEHLLSDVTTNEDLLANWRAFQTASGLAFVDFVGYHYRQHSASASHRPLRPAFITDQLRVAELLVRQAQGGTLAPVVQAFYYEKLLYLYSMILRQSNAADFDSLRRSLLKCIRGELAAALRCRPLSFKMKLVALASAFGGPLYARLCRRILTDRQA